MVASFKNSENSSNNERRLDKQQAKTHLEALGYKSGDNIYMRAFFPPDDPRSVEDKGRKADKLNFKQVERWQREGRGIYFVVNGGGHKNDDVKFCRAIFIEHDNLDKELQITLWLSLGLPEPTIQVDTGGKSIHSYWVLDESIPVQDWFQLQSDLLEYADGDRNIKNPSRVMRLAGAWHIKGDGTVNQSQIISNSGKRYSYKELRDIIPHIPQPTPIVKQLATINSGDVPLYQCLTKDDRALIDSGVGLGSRNSSGAKLARNLIGTAARLNYLGHRYDGDPRQLFDDYCNRCSPALSSLEADTIWTSAEKGNPTATLSDDALENCIKSWQRNQSRQQSGFGISNGGEKGTLTPPTSETQWRGNRENWKAPASHNGEIGFWKSDNDGNKFFSPACNFDFQVEREIEDADGGGLVLQVKRSFENRQIRIIINSIDYTKPDTFTDALKRALKAGIVCNLNKAQLNALIHTRLHEYRTTRQGRVFKRIDRYGQQEDGTWVFSDRQYKKDGTPTNENESGWVFNPSLGKDDFIPCPELALENPLALKELVDASREFFGLQNINQVLLTMGWVVAGLHFREIFKHHNSFPLFDGYGEPGSCKTLAAEAALSLVGKNWASHGMLARVSTSALYEHGERTGSLPFFWDDPARTPENEELAKNWYNCKPRRVRGNQQTPHSPMGITSNHVFGGEQAATYTRFVRVAFERATGGDKGAFQKLQIAQKTASGAFSQILALGYSRDEVAILEAELLQYLPLAHARIAQSLAITTWYAQKIVGLTDGFENIKQWVIDHCCKEENDADASFDSLSDFINKILALEAESSIGDWNLKRFVERDGQIFYAIYAHDTWKLVDQRFKPATYNERSLKSLILKAGGVTDTTIRFSCDRDIVLAYHRALITPRVDSEGIAIVPVPPQSVPRKAWLIPASLFGEVDLDAVTECNRNPVTPPNPDEREENETIAVTAVTECNRNPVTPPNPDEESTSDPKNNSCNRVTEKNGFKKNKVDDFGEKDDDMSSPSTQQKISGCNQESGYSSYTPLNDQKSLDFQDSPGVTENQLQPVTRLQSEENLGSEKTDIFSQKNVTEPPKIADSTPQFCGQRLHEGSNFDESQCNQQKKNVTEVNTALPPVGWWVVIKNEIAQVKQHISDDVVHLDGETIFGSYRISQFVVLTKEEMILRGLVWR